jgi:hypothetical protein
MPTVILSPVCTQTDSQTQLQVRSTFTYRVSAFQAKVIVLDINLDVWEDKLLKMYSKVFFSQVQKDSLPPL